MAARKPPVSTGTDLAKFDEELARRARSGKKVVADVGLGKFIGTAGGTLTFNGSEMPDDEMECIILDAMYENTYYAGAYNSDNKNPPDCYAYGPDDLDDPDKDILADMKPHEKAHDPQNPDCGTCPLNEWDSAPQGTGKACANRRRLSLTPAFEDMEPDAIPKADVAFLKVSPTSVKNWAAYVKQLDQVYPGKPFFCFVTLVKLAPHKKNQFEVQFSMVRELDRSFWKPLMDKQDASRSDMLQPYPDMPAEEEKPARAGKSASKIAGNRGAAKPPAKAAAAARGRR